MSTRQRSFGDRCRKTVVNKTILRYVERLCISAKMMIPSWVIVMIRLTTGNLMLLTYKERICKSTVLRRPRRPQF